VAHKLKVVDGQIALWVRQEDKTGGLAWGPGMAPQIGGAVGAGEDASHAAAGCVVGPGPGREVGDDLPHVSRASRKGRKEHTPVVQFIVDGGGKANAVAGPSERDIQAREKSEAAREHGRDAPKVTAKDLPRKEGALLGRARALVEEAKDLGMAVGRKGDEALNGVDNPSKKFLVSSPVGVNDFQFFDRIWGIAVPILGIVGPKEKIQGVKKVPPCLAERRGGSLSQGDPCPSARKSSTKTSI
jgi:hypothetical protein